MASKDAIAVKRLRATGRINAAIRAVAEMQGQNYPPLPSLGRDKELVHANQLEALATILESILAAMPAKAGQ